MPSMSGMRDDSFNMLTLVRPSLIPEDIEQSPSEQKKELQRTVLRANNKITELETEKRNLTETNKDLHIQLSVTSNLLKEMENQANNRNQRYKLSKMHDEIEKKNVALENKFATKTKENQALTLKLTEIETHYVALKEENELLTAKLASLRETNLVGTQLSMGDGQERTAVENVEKEVTKHSNHPHRSTSMPDTPEQQNTPKLVVSEPVCVEDVEDEKNQNRRKLTIRAFRGQADPLSNFYNIGGNKLHYSGKSFNSSEQAYQYTKAIFHGEKNVSKEILHTTDPRRIKKLGDFRESVAWKNEKVAFLQEILLKKAVCCSDFRAEVSDPNAVFVEAVQDPFWGSGMNYEETCNATPGQWTGANVMGTLLSKVRSRLPTLPKPRQMDRPIVQQSLITCATTNVHKSTTTVEQIPNKAADHPTDQKVENMLVIVGDSMIRNVHVKPLETDLKKFTMSGARIEDIEGRLPGIIGTTKPKTLIIHVGTNNLTNDSIDTIRQKYCNLLRRVKYICPESKVLISGIFLRSDKDHLLTGVTRANEVLQELCTAYTVDYVDNFLTRHIRVHSLKQDGLHLSRTGASDFSARLEKSLVNQHPFQSHQKGPVVLQEERGVGQVTHPSQLQNSKINSTINHQDMKQIYPWQMQNSCQVVQRQKPNPPYPTHIMPRYPTVSVVWPHLMGIPQQNPYH